MTDIEALQLHDRTASGEALTAEESTQLEAWYAIQDAAEAQDLGLGTEPIDLPERIRASLEQVAEAARRIQQTMTENDALRREIAGLRLELAQQTASSG